MLESVYLVFVGIAVLFTVLAFISSKLNKKGKEMPVFSLMAFFIMLILSQMSVEIEVPICDNEVVNATVVDNTTTYTTSWNCALYSYEGWTLTYFWGFLGLVMFVFAIFQVFYMGVEEVTEASTELQGKNHI